MEQYPSIFIAYSVALVGWVAVWRVTPQLWPKEARDVFEQPWREIGYALLAGVVVILVGQLYVRGYRLPNTTWLGPIFESVNQLAIFSPMIVLLVLRKHGPETAWIKKDRIGWRLLTGLGLALTALLAFTIVRDGADPWWRVVSRVYAYQNVGLATQVFLEDFTIAILAVRVAAAVGARKTAVIVASLFAFGHIPSMFSEGATMAELSSLLADIVLGVAIIGVALRARDIWWLWVLHFSMDMTQFERVAGIGS